MPFKTTVKKQSYAFELASSAKQLAPEVATIFSQQLAPFLREERPCPTCASFRSS